MIKVIIVRESKASETLAEPRSRTRRVGVVAAVLAVVVAAVLAACTSSKGNSSKVLGVEQKQQSQITQQLEKNQPIPLIKYSQLRQNLIEVKLAEAKGVQTTSFLFRDEFAQDPSATCPSIGVPIDASDQLTNPNQVVHDSYPQNGEALVIDQMDPTGEYSTSGASGATYVFCIGKDGEATPVYNEGPVTTVFAPAEWDTGTHTYKVVGPSSFDFTESQGHK